MLVENFGPGALDRMGFTWERIQELNPTHDRRLGQGLRPGPLRRLQGLRERRAMRRRRGSTTGFWMARRRYRRAIGDSDTGLHLAIGILDRAVSAQRNRQGPEGPRAMQDGVLNLCRVKLRDQQRLDRTGCLEEYPQYPNGNVRRRGAARRQCGRRRAAGLGPEVQGLGDRSERLHLLHHPGPAGRTSARRSASRTGSTIPPTRRPKRACRSSRRSSSTIEEWPRPRPNSRPSIFSISTTFPAGRSVHEGIADDPSLRATGTVVEVDHPKRGKYLTVGSPIKLSDRPTEVKRSPLLGEHTDEVLAELGYSAAEIAQIKLSGCTEPPKKHAAERHIRPPIGALRRRWRVGVRGGSART